MRTPRIPVYGLVLVCIACLPAVDEGNLYREELMLARAGVHAWALRCEGSASKEDTATGFCEDEDFQGDYDSTLWNGLLCASGGEAWACAAVRDSQSPDGRVWRSPRLRAIENGDIDRPTFSRDMALGALAYIVHTRDAQFGNAWARYIEDEGALCPELADTCWVGPQLYWLFNHVARDVGFQRLSPGAAVFFKGDASFLREDLSAHLADAALLGQMTGLYAVRPLAQGFEFHLVGTHFYILKRLGQWNESNQAAARLLRESQPSNPFYRYLAGEGPNAIAPDLLSIVPPVPPRIRYQWTFEKHAAEFNPLYVYDQSMGWEFIFLINLLLTEDRKDEQRRALEVFSWP